VFLHRDCLYVLQNLDNCRFGIVAKLLLTFVRSTLIITFKSEIIDSHFVNPKKMSQSVYSSSQQHVDIGKDVEL